MVSLPLFPWLIATTFPSLTATISEIYCYLLFFGFITIISVAYHHQFSSTLLPPLPRFYYHNFPWVYHHDFLWLYRNHFPWLYRYHCLVTLLPLTWYYNHYYFFPYLLPRSNFQQFVKPVLIISDTTQETLWVIYELHYLIHFLTWKIKFHS